MQKTDYHKITNTHDLESAPITLVIAPDHTGRAYGSMVFDHDTKIPDRNPESNTYRHYSLTYFDKRIKFNKLAGFDFDQTFD